jgi:hypothetical protein
MNVYFAGWLPTVLGSLHVLFHDYQYNLNYTLLFPTRLLTSEDECKWFWHQMIYFPGTINTVSTWLYYYIIYTTMDPLPTFQLCTLTYSVHAGISEPWRGRLPCFFVIFPSLTEIHVLPPPVSQANWRSLFRPGDSPPSFSKMASSFTGSAHSPFPGYDTLKTVRPCEALYSVHNVLGANNNN